MPASQKLNSRLFGLGFGSQSRAAQSAKQLGQATRTGKLDISMSPPTRSCSLDVVARDATKGQLRICNHGFEAIVSSLRIPPVWNLFRLHSIPKLQVDEHNVTNALRHLQEMTVFFRVMLGRQSYTCPSR